MANTLCALPNRAFLTISLIFPNQVISCSSPIQTIGFPLNTNIKLGTDKARCLQPIPLINCRVEKIAPINHLSF